MDLARELSALAEHVDWPPTPELQLALEPRRARRRALALAFAAIADAIAAAFAVPQSRGPILRFFHLGSATIVRVDRLPPAEERPLAAGIGPVISFADAKQGFPGPLLVPPLDPIPPAHLYNSSVVSFVFSSLGEPVLLSEFAFGEGFLKKLAVNVHQRGGGGFQPSSLWITGAVHDVYARCLAARGQRSALGATASPTAWNPAP